MKMMLKDAIGGGASFEEFRRGAEMTEEVIRDLYRKMIERDEEIGIEYDCLVDTKTNRIESIHPYCPNLERTRKLLETRKRRLLGIED